VALGPEFIVGFDCDFPNECDFIGGGRSTPLNGFILAVFKKPEARLIISPRKLSVHAYHSAVIDVLAGYYGKLPN
jgi:hypothetical protein